MWVCAAKKAALAYVDGVVYPVGALNEARTPAFAAGEICTSWTELPNPYALTMSADDVAVAYAFGVSLILGPWLLGFIVATLRRLLKPTWGR